MRLSIITINRNNAEGLSKTINSVLSQRRSGLEYIVIDGSSGDGSLAVVKRNEQAIDYWISEPDKGIYHAMNKGVLKATGEYCLFLNSGDTLEPDALEPSISFLDGSADIIYGDSKMIVDNRLYGYAMPKSISFLFLFQSALNHQSCFIKTSLLRQKPYDENMKIASDWSWSVEALLEGRKFLHIDKVIARYGMDGISSTNKELVAHERDVFISRTLPKAIIDDYNRVNDILGDDWHVFGVIISRHPFLRKALIIVFRVIRKLDKLLSDKKHDIDR